MSHINQTVPRRHQLYKRGKPNSPLSQSEDSVGANLYVSSLNAMAKVKFTAPQPVAETAIKRKGWKGETCCHEQSEVPFQWLPAVWLTEWPVCYTNANSDTSIDWSVYCRRRYWVSASRYSDIVRSEFSEPLMMVFLFPEALLTPGQSLTATWFPPSVFSLSSPLTNLPMIH